MSVICERAVTYFQQGFSCSQAVAAVFCDKYSLDERTVAKLAAGFAGGLKCGEVCGALAGAAMVVGMKHGTVEAGDKAGKAFCGDKTAAFVRLFRERHGSVTCRDLLGCDISTPDGRAYAVENKLFASVCLGLVMGAVELLEEEGY